MQSSAKNAAARIGGGNFSSDNRPVVLTLLGAFWPGNDSSGANQSFVGMASALSSEFDFLVVARDRPFADSSAATPTRNEGWKDLGFARAKYCSIRHGFAQNLRSILYSTRYDVLLINGFFDHEFTIPALFMRMLSVVPRRPTIVSPRGEFSPDALALRGFEKATYLRLARYIGLLDGIWLHATAEHERSAIETALPESKRVILCADTPRRIPFRGPPERRQSKDERIHLVYIGRFARVKNLEYAIGVLAHVTHPVTFDIYGPIDDSAYLSECRGLIDRMPEHVTVRINGEIENDAVPETLRKYDLFFLPTLGENFGHSIYEALASGVPVLISDRTIWRNLENRNAGWDIPLSRRRAFSEAIDQFARYSRERKEAMSHGARSVADEIWRTSDFVAKTRWMLKMVMSQKSG